MFFKRIPKIEEVTAQLLQLIEQARREMDRRANDSAGLPNEDSGELPTRMTLNVISWGPKDLIPLARQILTSEVARRADESQDLAKALIGYETVIRLPAADVDLYLQLVFGTIQSWLGKSSKIDWQKSIGTVGARYHSEQAAKYWDADRFDEAEEALRRTLGYAYLLPPDGFAVHTLCALSDALWMQGKKDMAREVYQAALNDFANLAPTGGESYEWAKQGIKQSLAARN